MISSSQQHPNRRQFLGTASAVAGAIALPTYAQEAKYPSKTITLVVPFPAGGSVDVAGRAIGERLSKVLGQAVIIDNKGGAGGAIGSTFAAKAKPDGYTLVVTSQSSHVANPAFTPNLPYDAIKDFAPITLIERLPNVLLINPALPVKNMAEFVAYAKANPGKLNYASSGNGSMLQLNMELLKSQYGIFLTHIPYRVAGTTLTDLMSGQVHAMFTNIQASNVSFVKQDKLRALAVASPMRSALLPDVPTFGELKQPELNMTSWTGLAAPAGTPEPIVQQLYEAVRTILQDPSTIAAWKQRGAIVPEAVRPAEYKKEIADRIAFYKKLVKTNNLSAE
ncbi:Bug family tripartite tricarboxylate transporter substrate binding protein [Rhodoferax ferrireducens]|uniref:Bug family tripartite tricarboxylate transporter substrate binding protein n=1 Tax=Rhodoferax ferrireducens TaxID=192843 RepID=UPI000E0D06E4|nr:tripartite tricarboxylate transporter substrate binding protein [Rhodoferax ferrireducens]